MFTLFIYACLIAAVIAWGLLKIVQYDSEKKLKTLLGDSTEQLTKPAFRCVSIAAGENACKEAQDLSKQRILVDFAPLLPLRSCNSAQCECKYLRYNDRRAGNDRREKRLKDSKHALAYENKRSRVDRRRDSIRDSLMA
jgi:hypothetical protein